MTENSIYNYINSPDRIIFSTSDTNQKINTIKIIGETFINKFSTFIKIENSRFVDNKSFNQIAGAFVTIKIKPEILKDISANKDLEDVSFVIDSERNVYCIIKKFFYTNNVMFVNTINEALSYIDIYTKTQLSKYGITEEDFVMDKDEALFGIFAGKEEKTIDNQLSNDIVDRIEIEKMEQNNKINNKNNYSTTISNKPSQKFKNDNEKSDYDLEREKLEKAIKPKEKKNGFFKEATINFLKEVMFGKSKVNKIEKEIEDKENKEKQKEINRLAEEERKHKLIKDKIKTKNELKNNDKSESDEV